MTTMLIRLNGAPDDEVAELRELLTANAIDFYETEAGRWGFSVAAIWLRDESQLQQARELIENYQQQRTARAQAAHAERLGNGGRETLFTRLVHEPLRTLLYLLLVVMVLYLSLLPFIGGI